MKAIIAINQLGFIGLNNGLPFHCKADLKHFAQLTAGQNLLVGYRTAQHLPPLKGRKLHIDTRGTMYPQLDEIDWCIGGRATYEKYQHLFTEVHISIIDDYTKGDTLAPDFSKCGANCNFLFYGFKPD